MKALVNVAPLPLPDVYLSLLRFSDGGEGPLPIQPFYFQLYPAKETAQIERDGDFKEFFADFFVFGGNGGGEAIAFDLRSGEPYQIVAFDMVNINLDESVLPIAASFDQFVEVIGFDEPDVS